MLQVSIVRVIVNTDRQHAPPAPWAWCTACMSCICDCDVVSGVAEEIITDSLADELDQAAQRMGHEVGQRRCCHRWRQPCSWPVMSTCIPCVHRLLQETSTAVAENLRNQFSGLAGTLHATLLQRDSLSWAVQQMLQPQVTECSTYPLHAPGRVFCCMLGIRSTQTMGAKSC